jgi:hypothetical protein
VAASSGAYGGGELVGGGYGQDSSVAGAEVPSAFSDDPLARDPYAGTR